MPKVLIYLYWIFLFYNTDYNENRGHVHVGKRATRKLCKIWLEPTVECADPGDLTDAQVKEVLELTVNYQSKLLEQWKLL